MRFYKLIFPLFFVSYFFINPCNLYCQLNNYSFEQVDSLQKKDKRNIVVFINTNWCMYCQIMKNTTFKNDSIIQILNNKFYFINFNAETEKSILFNGTIFKYKPTGNNTGIHELAEQLATVDNAINYPTICILNTSYEIVFQHSAFLNTTTLKVILKKM